MRFPAKWHRFAGKESRQLNMLEQILIAKFFTPGSGPGRAFCGICFSSPFALLVFLQARHDFHKIGTILSQWLGHFTGATPLYGRYLSLTPSENLSFAVSLE